MTAADQQNAEKLMAWLWPRVAIFGIALAVLFLSIPSIDIAIASLFKSDPHFVLSGTWAAKAQKTLIRWVTILSALTVIIGTVTAHLPQMKERAVLTLNKLQWRFLFFSLALGPGILVNAILKEFWGRARPQYVSELGGTAEFTPPFIMTDQCESNCSFVSGDSAIAFWTMAIAFVLPAHWQRPALAGGFLFGLIISLFRMAQGKHFTSDTLFAFVFVTLTAALCWGLVHRKERSTHRS